MAAEYFVFIPNNPVVLNEPGKHASRIISCVKIPNYVFAGINGQSFAPNGIDKVDNVHVVRIKDSDPTGRESYDTITLDISSAPGFSNIAYINGFIWVAGYDDIGGGVNNGALVRINPETLNVTITIYSTAVVPSNEPFPIGRFGNDERYIYVTWYTGLGELTASGLYRWDTTDLSFTRLGSASFAAVDLGGSALFLAALVDDTYVWGFVGTDTTYLLKVNKVTGDLVDNIQVPFPGDDVAQWTDSLGEGWIFIGYAGGAFALGQNIGLTAVRKSDLAMFHLPKLDVNQTDGGENYGLCVHKNKLLVLESNTLTYVIDLAAANPSTWDRAMTQEQLDVAVPRIFQWALPRWPGPAIINIGLQGYGRIPNEMIADDEEEFFHIFGFPIGIFSDQYENIDATSAYFRAEVLGISEPPPEISTLKITGLDSSVTLHGFIDDNRGGTMTACGFYFDSFSPPETLVPADAVPASGEFTATVIAAPGTYYVRAFGTSSFGTTEGDIVQVVVPSTPTRGFSGKCFLANGQPAVGASVYLIDISNDAVVAILTTDAEGDYSIDEQSLFDLIRPGKFYHLVANNSSLSKRGHSMVSRQP